MSTNQYVPNLKKAILGLIFILSFLSVQAFSPCPDKTDNKQNDPCPTTNNISIKFNDIPEGPSLFTIAGIVYIVPSAYCEINLESFVTGHLNYQLTDQNNKVIVWNHQRLRNGPNNISIPLAQFPVGVYKLDMSLEKEEKTIMIEKLSYSQIKASLLSKVE